MKCISVPVVDDQICSELFPMLWSYGMVCAGQADKNNCLVRTETNDPISGRRPPIHLDWICCPFILQSDSGSVMVCDGQLQGIHWYNQGCMSPPNPSTYTKICKYTRWIKDVMQRNSPTLPPPTPRQWKRTRMQRASNRCRRNTFVKPRNGTASWEYAHVYLLCFHTVK